MKQKIIKLTESVIVRVLVAVIVAAIMAISAKECSDPKNNKSITGKVVNHCDGSPVKGVKVGITGISNSQKTTDDEGIFEIEINGKGIVGHKLTFLHRNFKDGTKISDIDFSDNDRQNIGEFILSPKKGCDDEVINEKLITGQLLNDCDNSSIKDVKVIIDNSSTTTDEAGIFTIKVKGSNLSPKEINFSHKDFDSSSRAYNIDFRTNTIQDIGKFTLTNNGCTDCDEVTKILYNFFDENIDKKISHPYNVNTTISIDQAFELELKEELETYLKDNNVTITKNDCEVNYEIIRWIKRQDIDNYKVGTYEIPEGQKKLIDTFLDRIKQVKSKWKINFSSINCIGSADKQNIKRKGITLDRSKTNIFFPNSEPFHVYYGGCRNDIIISTLETIKLGNKGSDFVGQIIENNCELSAVRAFVMAKYIDLQLPEDISINYSAEGAIGYQDDSPENRRVRVELNFVGANDKVIIY